MAFSDRAYYREDTEPTWRRGLTTMSVVTWLLVINAAVFVLDSILTGSTRAGGVSLSYWGVFQFDVVFHKGQVWRLFTYQFLHADFWHILFNMLGLYFFGPAIEGWLGSRRFLAFYLLCGVSGAVVYSVLGLVPGLLPGGNLGVLLGASGSLFGILVASAVLFPHQRVMLLFPPVPMSMRTMALVFLGIAALSLIVGSQNAGGEAAHLGGAVLGFVLIKWPGSLRWTEGLSMPRRPAGERFAKQAAKRREQEQQEQAEVDRILDKVREHGLQSLTRAEKKALQRATDRQRRVG